MQIFHVVSFMTQVDKEIWLDILLFYADFVFNSYSIFDLLLPLLALVSSQNW